MNYKSADRSKRGHGKIDALCCEQGRGVGIALIAQIESFGGEKKKNLTKLYLEYSFNLFQKLPCLKRICVITSDRKKISLDL